MKNMHVSINVRGCLVLIATVLLLATSVKANHSSDIDPNEALEVVRLFYVALTAEVVPADIKHSVFFQPRDFYDGKIWTTGDAVVDAMWTYYQQNTHLFVANRWPSWPKTPIEVFDQAIKGYGYFNFTQTDPGFFRVMLYQVASDRHDVYKVVSFVIARDVSTGGLRINSRHISINGVRVLPELDLSEIDLSMELGFKGPKLSPLTDVNEPNNAEIMAGYTGANDTKD